MIWAKPPAVDTPLSRSGTANVGSDVNGGGYVQLSPTSHKDYTFTWGASPAKDIYDIVDYRSGAYGDGLLYYLDPFAMRTNILPQSFSVPSLLCDIGKMSGTVSPASGARTVATNLFTNPDFERTSGTVEVWRNYMYDPNGMSPQWSFWGGTGNTVSNTTVDAPWSKSGKARRAEWSGVVKNDTGDVSMRIVDSLAAGTLVGTRITAVKRTLVEVAGIPLGPPTLVADSGSIVPATISRSRSSAVVSDGVTVIEDWVTFVVPENVPNGLRIYTDVRGYSQGFAVQQSMGDIYEGNYQPHRQWFSGTYSPDPDLTPSFTGATNNSPSVLRGISLGSVTGGNERAVIQSESFDRDAKSLRVIRQGSMSNASAGALVWSPTASQVARVFTAAVYCTIPNGYDPKDDFVSFDRVCRGMYFLNGVGNGSKPGWVQAPSTPGKHLLRMVFVIEDTANNIRLAGGGAIGQSVLFEGFTIVEGNHPELMPFSGSRRPSGYTSRWTGAVNNSTSELQIDITSGLYTQRPLPVPKQIENFDTDRDLDIPIPPNYSLWVNYTASVPCLHVNGTVLQETQPDASVKWHRVTGNWATLRWSRVGPAVIWGAQAVILPDGETPPPVPEWYLGHGNWGLRFSAEPQVTGISTRLGGEGGLLNGSASFKETGLWE